MASKKCEVCGKQYGTGHNVSHSNRKTHRKWKPNLQSVKVKLANGGVVTANICTRCLKSNKVLKA